MSKHKLVTRDRLVCTLSYFHLSYPAQKSVNSGRAGRVEGIRQRANTSRHIRPSPSKAIRRPFLLLKFCPDNHHLHSGHRGSECNGGQPSFGGSQLEAVGHFGDFCFPKLPIVKPLCGGCVVRKSTPLARPAAQWRFSRKISLSICTKSHYRPPCVRYTYLVKEKQSYTQKIRARYKNGVKNTPCHIHYILLLIIYNCILLLSF